LELSRKQKPLSVYEEARKELLDYLAGSVFPQFLVPPTNVPFNEVFFFSNVARVKRRIVGTPRAAIHMALNNPYHYLEVSKVYGARPILSSNPYTVVRYLYSNIFDLKIKTFRDIVPCSLGVDRHFRGAYCLHYQKRKKIEC